MSLKLRVVAMLTFVSGVLYRTKNFTPDYRYTVSQLDLGQFDEVCCISLDGDPLHPKFLDILDKMNEAATPCTVGGDIRHPEQVNELFRHGGADKVVIARAFMNDLAFLEELVAKYGSQAVVAGIDLERFEPGKAFEYAAECERLGAGEILLNSIERDGSVDKGLDLAATDRMYDTLERIPFMVAGGCGNWEHASDAFQAGADAVCTSNIFHLTAEAIERGKRRLQSLGNEVRV